MSLYGYNKSLVKETGDWVRAGEVIAYSSQSQKNKESGLYFEIRKKGKPHGRTSDINAMVPPNTTISKCELSSKCDPLTVMENHKRF